MAIPSLPVVTVPNITTTAGGVGTAPGNQDIIYVQRSSDLVLWESGIRAAIRTGTASTEAILRRFMKANAATPPTRP